MSRHCLDLAELEALWSDEDQKDGCGGKASQVLFRLAELWKHFLMYLFITRHVQKAGKDCLWYPVGG